MLTYKLVGHKGRVSCLAFHPTEPWLATGGHDGTVRLWKEGKEVQNSDFGGPIDGLAFHPNGKQLAVHGQLSFAPGKEESVLHFLDVASWTPVISKKFKENWGCLCLAFSPNGSALAATYQFESSVKVFDGQSGEYLQGFRIRGESPQDSSIICVVFLDNDSVVSGGIGQNVLVKSPIGAGKK